MHVKGSVEELPETKPRNMLEGGGEGGQSRDVSGLLSEEAAGGAGAASDEIAAPGTSGREESEGEVAMLCGEGRKGDPSSKQDCSKNNRKQATSPR
jgi:hypothetical protein